MAKSEHEPSAKQALLRSAVQLFLERGYQKATLREIAQRVGMTTGSIFGVFEDKEAILDALVGYMFQSQFQITERAIGRISDPAKLYGAETALQLHVTELSESLRDVYVMAYSLPRTSRHIYEMTANKLMDLFAETLPEYEAKDFYELEIATAGIARAYMAYPCDLYFTIDRKIERFLETTLAVYRVPPERRTEIFGFVHSLPLKALAERLIAELLRRANDGSLSEAVLAGLFPEEYLSL